MVAQKKPTSALKAEDYVHLHNHTQYSLLDGLTKVPALVEFIKGDGMEAVAITDHGTLSGVIEFYKEAKKAEIKPIIGMETYVAERSHTDKDSAKDKNYYHLIVLAMNNTGYQNLMRLSSIANLDGFYYKPRVDHELLEKYNEGLIILSGCIGGEVADNIRNDQLAKAKTIAKWYKKVFGDRYYLEIQDHGHPDHPSRWPEQTKVNDALLKLGQELDIPCVLTCDAHYLKPEDKEAHEILLCVQTGSFLSDEKRMSLNEFELHVMPAEQVIARWGKDHPEIILNSRVIADRCDVTIELGKILTPKFPVPKAESDKSYLEKLVWQGLAWRYGSVKLKAAEKLSVEAAQKKLTPEIIERAQYELETIDSMGFNSYFLIVQDFIVWGKNQGIVFGPGRGSAAGSIVAYAIRVTEIEPLKYKLMFERFLNPNRISMPDIDIDIQDSRRDEVIKYCVDKYGENRVANIVTFGRMAARNAVRDVARVLQMPYIEADRLAKMIPPPVQGRHIPLKQSLKDSAELKQAYAQSEDAKKVFDLAVQLEGTIRSHGVHAAGVVIAPEDIVNYVPLEKAQKGVVATQYPMGPIEELGLLKMDFLGLSNLTVIKNALRIIKRVYKADINLEDISNEDPKTFELLQRADTTGIFQLESAGMKRYLKELKPTLFEDIIAMNALYRPGPMSEIPRFIESKNNPASIKYLHKSLQPVLQDTYGVMVYQEQITQLLQLVAGYSLGEADLVRKAIGKKNRSIMMAEEPKFIEGCRRQGLSEAQAKRLWAQIQPFADYSFNKAHATCYAQIAYWTAYLKAHYPAAFMAALMTSDYNDTDRLAIEITECQHMGIDVLPPDVNESFVEFAVVPGKENQIRFGMSAIKNVGTGVVESILKARQTEPFANLEDFFARVDSPVVNRKVMESLIKAGAFDRYAERPVMLHNLDTLLAYGTRLHKNRSQGQTDLFNGLQEETFALPKLALETPTTGFTLRDQLTWERELLGLYLSQHPLAAYDDFLKDKTTPLKNIKPTDDGKAAVVGGAINDAREITTKNGQKMAFVKLEDRSGEIELVVFPSIYQQTEDVWVRDHVVLVHGKVSSRDRSGQEGGGEAKILVDQAREITHEEADTIEASKPEDPKSEPKPVSHNPRIYIRLESSDDPKVLLSLKNTLDNFSGTTDVVLVMGPEQSKQAIKLPSGVSSEENVLQSLQDLVGASNVRVR
ncbi:MAG TPA: DNA polymerase III subunit alpha [Candidatus Binatia bacterium]|nr:DNA polymerase III subunit alpha [Candidatus Binatia bacterium]